ncbi:AbrB family transcriptional regulator [Ignicoccus pacificus DSM 13166]|uniref:AbrB family transcriptional regulator n=1 Tax=Ignicoccus pacificus DSM 13166 TaxID=940294 RepID=A0A977K9P1_9CREN|nr:AbrB family transcriptional regulator [Ignicoccus pacificus DSM 13166]
MEEMRIVELLRVDSKGRVTIPRTVRDALNIVEGGYVIMIADLNKNEIVLTPTGGGSGRLLDVRVVFQDVKGKLAEISEKLAELGVDQISTSCRTIKKGGEAECIFVIEVPENINKEDLEKVLSELEGVKEVTITSIPSH